MFFYPDSELPVGVAGYEGMPNFLQVYMEGECWCNLMRCRSLLDLNALTEGGKLRKLIRVEEVLHENRFFHFSDVICKNGVKLVLIAGPSASGKTTSAYRLATQLRVVGKEPVLISLDDYYIDRDKILPEPDGNLDMEHINTIDTALFCAHIKALLTGETVEIPCFDFRSGRRCWMDHLASFNKNTVIIVEGLHGLNPLLLPPDIDQKVVFKLYVTPILPLGLYGNNIISSDLLRLIRRTVRDYKTRGASVCQTMLMWESVRKGEKRWILPFRESADGIFNSATLYELAVLKKYMYPLLENALVGDTSCELVQEIMKVLNEVIVADVDDDIPPTSIVREFIGGNRFYS